MLIQNITIWWIRHHISASLSYLIDMYTGFSEIHTVMNKNVSAITHFRSPCSEFIMICTKYFIHHEAEKVLSEWVGDLFYRTKVNQRLKVGTLMHLFVDSLSKKYVDLCYAHQLLCMNWSLQASTIWHWYFENVDVTEQFNYLPLVSTCRIWK